MLVSFRKSLTAKLVLAFTLVAVPPILIAGYVAAQLVNELANAREYWLQHTSRHLLRGIRDTETVIAAAHALLPARFARKQPVFSPEELQALSSLHVDCVVLRDASGSTLLSGPRVLSVAGEPLYPGGAFRWVTMQDGKQTLAVVARRDITLADGSEHGLELVSLSGIRLAESDSEKAVALRIFLPDGDGFRQEYTSLPSGPHVLPPAAIDALRAGSDEYAAIDKDRPADDPDAYVIFTPVRDDRGGILAVFAVSVPMPPHPSYARLFWPFLLGGLLLSGCTGYALAQTLTRPIRRLTDGVRSIAAGDFNNRVTVPGDDEVAALSAGFNLMATQLELKQHENLQADRHERARLLGEIALGFAHEIRNPLLVIQTSAKLVYDRLSGNDKESRLLGFVIEEVGRIDKILSEFLAFAKPVPLRLDYCRLNALVSEVLELTAAECAARGIVCAFVDEAGQSDRVLVEADKIRQVLLNLVLNSLDAMPRGGSLSIRVEGADQSPSVCFEVRDTGVGIPESLLPTIHLPFISTKKKGLGLGLAKVYAIVEEHGGSISCVSTPGQGTAFTVCRKR
ncbi:MAG: HAMP domain-containing protein [Deltaproteobacteria bacterium]|jgi:signal transduction histidine kinase|nr:HAMP domain-containing protein [Deltaproteobacteria bacterium]